MRLRELVLSGVVWTVGATLVRRVVLLGVNIVLARMLEPADFAIVVMATVLAELVAMFGELGIAAAIVQRETVEERHLSTGFWINVGAGLALAGVIAVLSRFTSVMSEDARLGDVMAAISVQFVVTGTTGVHQAMLWRDLGHRKLARLQTISLLISAVTAVALVLTGAGLWAIVALNMVDRFVNAALLWITSEWRPRLMFDRAAAHELFGFGLFLAGTRMLGYLARNVDNLIVGKLFGATELGYYSRAYALMLGPTVAITHVIGRVLFPALSRIQNDPQRMELVVTRAFGAFALVMYPAIFGLFTCAEPLVKVVLGDRWSPMVPLLRILCPVALWQCFGTILVGLYGALGKTSLQFRVSLVGHGASIAGIILGAFWGTTGVAAGYLVGSFVAFVIDFRASTGLIGLSSAKVLREILPAIVASTVMAALATAAGRSEGVASRSSWVQLLVMVGTGVVTYVAAIAITRPPALGEVIAALRRRGRGATAPASSTSPPAGD